MSIRVNPCLIINKCRLFSNNPGLFRNKAGLLPDKRRLVEDYGTEPTRNSVDFSGESGQKGGEWHGIVK